MASIKILLPLLLLAAAAAPVSLAVIDLPGLLAGRPQYASFLKLLVDTKVADEVSKMKAASVLVVPEKSIKPLLSLPPEKQKMVIQNHVLLKYFDPIQLGEMKERTAMLPTLLSTTDKRLGVINYSKADDGQMYLRAPGAPGAAGEAKLVKVVAARPFAVSVMEISSPIMCAELQGPGAKAAGAKVPGRRGKGGKGGKGKIKPMSDESGGNSAAAAGSASAAAPSKTPAASS